MKLAGLLVLAIFASCQAVTLEEIKQIEKETNAKILLSPSLMAVAPKADGDPTPTLGKNICEKNVLWYVNPNTGATESKPCPEVAGATTGFCNCAKNNCQRTLPTCPAAPASNCDATVYDKVKFPSHTKCDEFQICLSGKLEVGKCISPLRYNSKEQRCTSGAPCANLGCPINRNFVPISVRYPPDLRFYLTSFEGICRFLRCDEGYAMDKDSCAYECKASGMYADLDPSSSKYHVCTGPANGPFTRKEYDCGEGLRFDETLGSCGAPTSGTGNSGNGGQGGS